MPLARDLPWKANLVGSNQSGALFQLRQAGGAALVFVDQA